MFGIELGESETFIIVYIGYWVLGIGYWALGIGYWVLVKGA